MFDELFKNVKAAPERLGGGLIHFCPAIFVDEKKENKDKLVPIMYDKKGNYIDFEK